jgi:thioredoxin reductase (NADPH)
MAETYDMVIIGGGAAGFTAALYAARDRCQVVVIERMAPGGQVLNCEHIENYPGFPDGVAGYTLGPLLQQQAMQLGVSVQLTEVEAVQLDGEIKVLQTGNGAVRTRAVTIATGSSFTMLGVPGEAEFLGRGVSHCAPCDGAMFLGQPVAVIGGGDAALDEGIYLTQYASQVTVVHRRGQLRACQLLQDRAKTNAKIVFRWHTMVRAIEGEGGVQRLQVEDVTTGAQSTLEVAGVFPYLGLTPNTAFLNGLVPLNARGQIVTDLWMRTAVPGILAAGDVRGASARQLISAAGDGATAALAAIHYLRTGQW